MRARRQERTRQLPRTRAEIEKYQERDPIKLFTSVLKENDVIDDGQIANFEKEIKEQVEHAVRFAEESPEPDPGELYTDVYSMPINN